MLLLPYLGRRVVRTSPAAVAAVLRARVIPLPSDRTREDDEVGGEPEIAREIAREIAPEIAPDLSDVRAALAACHPNGCCVVACERSTTGARGDKQRSASLAVVVMKYTDKAIVEL